MTGCRGAWTCGGGDPGDSHVLTTLQAVDRRVEPECGIEVMAVRLPTLSSVARAAYGKCHVSPGPMAAGVLGPP